MPESTPDEETIRIVREWRDRLRDYGADGFDDDSAGAFPAPWLTACAERMRSVHVRDTMLAAAISPRSMSDDAVRSMILRPHDPSSVWLMSKVLESGPDGQDPSLYIHRLDWAADVLERMAAQDVPDGARLPPLASCAYLRWYSGDSEGARLPMERVLEIDPRCTLAAIVAGAVRAGAFIHGQDKLRKSVEPTASTISDPSDPLGMSMGESTGDAYTL